MRPAVSSTGQVARAVVVYGSDPMMGAYWDGLAERTALELSPFGAPLSVRAGMTGSPEKTYYGDPGPIGGLPAPSYGARRAFPSLNAEQALPNTSSPVDTSSLKALLGEYQ